MRTILAMLAIVATLLLTSSVSAQCAGGACGTYSYSASYYTPFQYYYAPATVVRSRTVTRTAPVVVRAPMVQTTVVESPAVETATVVETPAVVMTQPVVVGYRRPFLGWRYNFSLAPTVVVEQPVVTMWSLVR